MYKNKIKCVSWLLGNTLCWTLWEDVFTQNTGKYFLLNTGEYMLNIVVRYIYTKYSEILYVEPWEDLFTQNTVKYFLFNTWKINLHKILGNTLCWAPWEDLFTQNTVKYFLLNTWKINLHTILRKLYVEHCGKICLHIILGNTLCWTLGRLIYTKYWEILYVEHCGKIYLHKILRNIYVEHCWKIYLPKIVGNTYVEHCSCWKIYLRTILGILYVEHWEDLFTQNTGKYWKYLCWTLLEDLFT